MRLIESPDLEPIEKRPALYLAGYTMGPDWRSEIVKDLSDLDITILNPWPSSHRVLHEPAKRRQMEWEHHRLRQASLIAFWFSQSFRSPMRLFELGALLERGRPLVIGVEPDYTTAKELEYQVRLRRPRISFSLSIAGLCKAARLELKRLEDWTQ